MSVQVKEKKQIEMRERSATTQADAKSWNAETRTLTVTFATDTPNYTRDWDMGEFMETLGFESGMVRMGRADIMPALLDHRRGSEFHIGTVVPGSIKFVGKSLTAEIQILSTAADVIKKIEEGILKSVSVGYRVYDYEETGKAIEGLVEYRATDWEPMEISFVTIPADPKSGVRSEGSDSSKNQVTIHKIQKAMEEKEKAGTTGEEKKIALTAEDLDKAREEGSKAATKRVTDITALGREFGHLLKGDGDEDFITKAIADNQTVEQVRDALLAKTKAGEPTIKVGTKGGWKGEGERATAQTDAILYRMNNEAYKDKVKDGNEFVGMKLMDHIKMYAEENNLRTAGSAYELIKRVFDHSAHKQRGGGLATGDFPNVFSNVMSKYLRKDFTFEHGLWKPLFYKEDTNLVNTKTSSINISEFGDLKPIVERGEFKNMSVSEVKEDFMVTKYGGKISISLEMIINDQLGAIERILRAAARTNFRTEDTVAWAALLGNPIMADTNALFSVAHNNLATGSAMSVASVQELITMILTQPGIGGSDDLPEITPRFLVHGPANQFVANNLTSNNFTPAKITDQVPAYIKSLTPIMTRKIKDNAFYLIADPDQIDTIRWGELTGEPGFAMEEQYEFDNDSYDWKMRKFMGASPTEWRSMAKNPGN